MYCVVKNMVKDSRIMYGDGACEIACSLAVAQAADKVRKGFVIKKTLKKVSFSHTDDQLSWTSNQIKTIFH